MAKKDTIPSQNSQMNFYGNVPASSFCTNLRLCGLRRRDFDTACSFRTPCFSDGYCL